MFLAEKNETEMRSKFLEIENNVKKRLHTFFSILNERVSFNKSEAREYEDECIKDEGETDASTHFLMNQKNQMIDLMQHLERYAKTLPVFGFNSGRYDINLIKPFLIPYIINGMKLNLQLLRNQTTSCPLNLEMFSSVPCEVFGLIYYRRLFSKSLQSQ